MSSSALPLDKTPFNRQLQDLKRFKRNPLPLVPHMFEHKHRKEAATVMLESRAKEPQREF